MFGVSSTLPPGLARRMGREELMRGGRGEAAAAYPPTKGHGAAAGIARNVAGRGQATSASGGARFELTTGALSGGLMAGIVLGFVGLYLWTRGHQA